MRMPQVSHEGYTLSPDVIASFGRGEKRTRGKGMPKVDEPWASSPLLVWDASGSKKVDEGLGDTQATEWPLPEGEEQMRIGACKLAALQQVLIERRTGRGMNRDETAFAKLGLANDQAIGRDIGKAQAQGFRDPQACRRQQPQERGIGVRA